MSSRDVSSAHVSEAGIKGRGLGSSASLDPGCLPIVFVPAGGLPVPPVRGGGVERYIASLATELAGLGFPVQILDRSWPSADRMLVPAVSLVREIGLEDLPAVAGEILAGQVNGRVLVRPR